MLEVVCHDANGFTAADATHLVYVPVCYIIIMITVMITVIITEFGILCFGISRFEDEDYTIRITMIECVNKLMLQGPS